MCRTQHGISAVSPSHGFTTGFRKVASRVSPGGNWSNAPREIQDPYPGFRCRRIGESRYPTSGTAKMRPTSALKRTATFSNMPRLEIPTDEFIEVLPRRVARLRKADLEIEAVVRRARLQHRRLPLRILVYWARHRANQENRIPVGQR